MHKWQKLNWAWLPLCGPSLVLSGCLFVLDSGAWRRPDEGWACMSALIPSTRLLSLVSQNVRALVPLQRVGLPPLHHRSSARATGAPLKLTNYKRHKTVCLLLSLSNSLSFSLFHSVSLHLRPIWLKVNIVGSRLLWIIEEHMDKLPTFGEQASMWINTEEWE